ncbi:MAG: NAD(+) synthase [Myxococcota bacterium]|nr:NAD(+) synthase [Myxococcota bacterium]
MKPIKVAAAVLNQTPLDWDSNAARIRGALTHAREAGVDAICLPEMCITGYGVEDFFQAAGVLETAWAQLESLLPETDGLIACLALPVMYRDVVYNTAAMVCDGALLGIVPKRHLAGDGLHYEPRWFSPWPQGEVGTLRVAGREVPIGDLHFDCGGVIVGVEVCRDAWVVGRPARAMSHFGVDIVMNPSASHFAFGKLEIRKRLCIEASRDFGVTYIHSNLLGNEAGRAIYDGGSLIASAGELVATGKRFGYLDGEVTMATVDLDQDRARRRSTPAPVEERCVRAPFTWKETDPIVPPALPGCTWETSERLKEESFTRAVALGLFDYLRKSRSRGFVVSLSGGADSAACTCLVKLMVELALDDLGFDGFKERLGHIPALQALEEEDEIVGCLLTTAYQATRNSGDVTRAAARAVAEAVGARHLELDVDAMVQGYIGLVQGAIGRTLTWEQDDVTLQNIQARSRGPSVWMLANLSGALLLATSNRSEAAVGYATMDGDTCGGLSPIAGIDKAFLRQWLRWLEVEGPQDLGPIPALEAVNAQQPTAELRPAEMGQTDEGDLMPYPILDAIEREAIRDKRLPVEVYLGLRERFDDLDAAQLARWVERFFVLWCRNQWKRERYAPSFHVDDENLDPRSWCRFPILSGGFERELAELRALVAEER